MSFSHSWYANKISVQFLEPPHTPRPCALQKCPEPVLPGQGHSWRGLSLLPSAQGPGRCPWISSAESPHQAALTQAHGEITSAGSSLRHGTAQHSQPGPRPNRKGIPYLEQNCEDPHEGRCPAPRTGGLWREGALGARRQGARKRVTPFLGPKIRGQGFSNLKEYYSQRLSVSQTGWVLRTRGRVAGVPVGHREGCLPTSLMQQAATLGLQHSFLGLQGLDMSCHCLLLSTLSTSPQALTL